MAIKSTCCDKHSQDPKTVLQIFVYCHITTTRIERENAVSHALLRRWTAELCCRLGGPDVGVLRCWLGRGEET